MILCKSFKFHRVLLIITYFALTFSVNQLVAMGRATATQLKELGLTVSAVASSPKPESLLTALKQLK